MGGPIDGFARSIGEGVSTVVGRAVGIVAGAFDAIVTAASSVLPGPLLAIAVVAAAVLLVWLVFVKR
jgi:hypothetical protein